MVMVPRMHRLMVLDTLYTPAGQHLYTGLRALVLKVTPWKTNGAIGNPLPHWISHTPLEIQPPQKSNGVSEFQWISRLMCSIGIPIPHRNSKHTMNNYFSPLEIQWVFHSFVMDGQRNEHSKTNIDFKSVKIHLGSLENRCPLKPLSCL